MAKMRAYSSFLDDPGPFYTVGFELTLHFSDSVEVEVDLLKNFIMCQVKRCQTFQGKWISRVCSGL